MEHNRTTGFLDAPGTFMPATEKWQAAVLLVSLALTSAITYLLVLGGRL